jgi:hypothetical protein
MRVHSNVISVLNAHNLFIFCSIRVRHGKFTDFYLNCIKQSHPSSAVQLHTKTVKLL